jgi:Ser/Thr protein kinase RdoA (MazF antagonist)
LANSRTKLTRITGRPFYRVDSGEANHFVLRIHMGERLNDAVLTTQLHWMQAICAETEVQTAEPVSTQFGRLFVSIKHPADEGYVRAVLLRWVEGKRASTQTFVRPRKLYAVGRTTALLHQHATTYCNGDLSLCPRWDADHFLGPRTCVGPRGLEILTTRQHDVVRRAADRIRRVMRRLDQSPDQFGLIHADLEPPNWVFHKGQPRPIDFDEFGLGYFAFDLMQIIWTHALWDHYASFRENLLAGYDSIRPISKEYRRHLDLFQAIPFLWWLNKGLVQKPNMQNEFRRWLAPTIRRVRELCALRVL